MNIIGKKVVLRAIEQEDLKSINKWSNDPEINYKLGGWHFPSSMQDQQKWYENLSVKSNNQRFAIETFKGELIGVANLVEINWKDRNAFHGMLLGDSTIRGKGYGTDTVMTLAKYAFEELGLKRLDTTIIANNEASLGLYMNKCGWKQEGVKKDYYFRKNAWWDMIILGLTASDFAEPAKALGY
ncbi:MAG: GNAT family N-acetyltransferase [Flavobacteriaceae bacterium]|nr:GNAT family N-acetyltransferase [Flavobacteriaceae bacterium]